MQKIGVIISFYLTIAGCSSSRIARMDYASKEEKAENIEYTEKINRPDFNINRADLKITSEEKEIDIIASLKYRKPGSYLASFKNSTGIEAARVFITDDTLIINDRFARKTYYGSADKLLKNYGLSTKYIPLLFGFIDTLEVNRIKEIPCNNGMKKLKSENETETTNYTINCRNKSIAAVEILKKADGKIVNIKYTGKIESGKLTLPSKVIVSNNFGGEQIEILIKKLQSEELEEISFSEGRNYEKVEIK